ncbi:GspE/PulE family protein [Marinomonas ostreistagni]|uniref:Flp pilus assembly complex ATPase component TadA n=1 Tax=Marinomonas ostreistagni TaxID=359209 RepID=A0ABS0ZEC3_9GAMM|nr:ATPase, T2SS/T4P/T4SS family [Marinomonas ostreistagni]MBJ7551962.1 Flp pilus assembly complex ATPase component TadA [Marinomonas ostreistagni]
MNLEKLIRMAIDQGASDIHILIQDNLSYIKLRTSGKLSEESVITNGAILLNRIKILSNLNIAEARRVQEGMFAFEYGNQNYSIRVSIMCSDRGEKVALRILNPSLKLPLSELGLSEDALAVLTHSIQLKHGLILVCGATGSGKTTTLYSCLNEINDGSRSIFTIEDPVEIPTTGLYQFEPDLNLDIGTHDLLKAFMRQDPDVIMIGEIRDAKTADLAISAALTGHLVLATLHTNNALNVIHRCENWQVDYFALVSSLKLIIHQSMMFKADKAKPKFTFLQPNWEQQLPRDYSQLITQPDMWHHLEGTE